ncbi:MAG: dipicolinate synthase subunit DpsA [Limnochordia bacterium]|jgi:dipicolinate synthase subunit A
MGGRLQGITIGLLGGDRREIRLLEALVAEGARVHAVGYLPSMLPPGDVHPFSDPVAAVTGVDVVIAPMSNTDQEGWIKSCPDPQLTIKIDAALCRVLPPGTPLLIGVAKPIIRRLARDYDLQLVETAEDDELAILNSIPTAEGALQLAMDELPITIHGSRQVVIGFGRCGITLARLLAAVGAQVTVVARSSAQRARALEMGLGAVDFGELKEVCRLAQAVHNTVPHLVLTREILEVMAREVVIIDLASAPGGTDFQAAEELGIKARLALALPGQVAPVTAGEILAATYPGIILRSLRHRTGPVGGAP